MRTDRRQEQPRKLLMPRRATRAPRPRACRARLVFPAQQHAREESGGKREDGVLLKEPQSHPRAARPRRCPKPGQEAARARAGLQRAAGRRTRRTRPHRVRPKPRAARQRRRAWARRRSRERRGRSRAPPRCTQGRRTGGQRARKAAGRSRLGGRGARLKHRKRDLDEVACRRGLAHRRSIRAPT